MEPDTKRAAIVVGDLLVDEIVDGGTGMCYAGGAGYNTAVGLADQGLDAHLIATIGDDHFGGQLRADAASHGVTLWSPDSKLATGLAISSRIDGEPHYVFNEGVTERFWSFEDIESIPSTWVVVNSYNFGVTEDVERLLEFVDAGGHRLVIDPNVRPTLLTDLAAYRRGVLRLAAAAAVVKLSTADIEVLNEPPREFTDQVLEQATQCVVTTRGASGLTVTLAGQHPFDLLAPSGGPVIDTMGAGDAVTAGIVAGLVASGEITIDVTTVDWPTILTEAMHLARTVISHPGGHPNPSIINPEL